MKDSDTAIAKAYKQQLIEKNMSVDICKECPSFQVNPNDYSCKNDQPSNNNCNLLKIYHIS